MVKGQQAWVGLGFGLLVLVAVFGAAYALTGADVAVDGGPLESADGPSQDGTAGGSDSSGKMATSGADGDVRSFGSDGVGSNSSGSGSGIALRVVTDQGSVESAPEATTSSSSSTTAAPTSTTAVPESTTTTTLSSTTSTTTATTAEEKTTTTGRTTTTQPPASSSSSTTATTEATTTTSPPTTVSDSGSPEARTFEQEVIRLTNEERSAGGCEPLTNNGKLHAAALGHSVDMAENDYFSHTGQDGSSMTDRIERQGYSWRSLAENIAAGYRTPASVVDGWMNSSGHRRNIMNCDLTEIGVGFHGFYWTQNFGTPR